MKKILLILILGIFFLSFTSASYGYNDISTGVRLVNESTTIIGGNLTTFLELTDTPSSYIADKCVFVNGAGNALILDDCVTATSIQSANTYIFYNSSTGAVLATFNETRLNNTIDLRAIGITWAEIINGTVYLSSNPQGFISWTNATNGTLAETSTILGWNYYNSTDFDIADYFTASQVLGFSYYNSTTFPDNYLKNDGDTATGNYTFDTSTFFIDSTNDRVGIGTMNPRSILEVKKDQNAVTNMNLYNTMIGSSFDAGVEMILGDDDSNNNLIIRQSGDGAKHTSHIIHQSGSGSDLEIENINTIGGILLKANGNMGVYVEETGNVGIGTSSPLQALDVADNILRVGPSRDQTFEPGDIPNDTGGIILTSNIAQGRQSYIWQDDGDVGEGGLYLQSSHFPIVIEAGTQSASDVLLNPSGGNVGIGTTSPQNKLNVVGDINFTGLIYGNGSQLTGLTLTETDPLWTGNSTNVAYLNQENTFTENQNISASNLTLSQDNFICLNQGCTQWMMANSSGVYIQG